MSLNLAAVDTGNGHAASGVHVSVKRADVDAAVSHDRQRVGLFTADALMAEVRRGVSATLAASRVSVSDQERDALTQEVALAVHRQHGWTPARSAVGRHYVATITRRLLTHDRQEWRDVESGYRRLGSREDRAAGNVQRVQRNAGSIDARTAALTDEDGHQPDPGDLYAALESHVPDADRQHTPDDALEAAHAVALAIGSEDGLALSPLDTRRVRIALSVAALAGTLDDDADREPVAIVADALGIGTASAETYRRAGARILRAADRKVLGQLAADALDVTGRTAPDPFPAGRAVGVIRTPRHAGGRLVGLLVTHDAAADLTREQRAARKAVDAVLTASGKGCHTYRPVGKRDERPRMLKLSGPVVGGQLAADRALTDALARFTRKAVGHAALPVPASRDYGHAARVRQSTHDAPLCWPPIVGRPTVGRTASPADVLAWIDAAWAHTS